MASASFSPPLLFIFNRENYHIWVVKMKTYLQAYDLWEVVNANVELAPLRLQSLKSNTIVTSELKDTRQRPIFRMASRMSYLHVSWPFADSRVIEKVITTLPERYESKISSLEDSRDLLAISLLELINGLYAQEQRRASRHWKHAEEETRN
ncbi:hypothetical protein CXB51_023996 [Gossypium anomalum]|uniref:DUF4219 domain-containing protein n=1 Tax=Gossypium anomalum TaxID=47600 RepID=A0A8J5YJ25_9ROSI|nr:hypothetical protein CXB51_023996 [Gossypium anomalum]